MKDGLARTASTLARVSARYVPDAFAIASVLSLLTLLLGILVGGATPEKAVLAWGNGFWSLLSFSMQIALVIFAGYVLAVAPPVQKMLDALAGIARTPRQAVFGTAFLSMTLCWLNWGMGLIASAVLVRMMARRHPGADYRLLVASAYLGLGTTWHGGPSGTVPLLLATPDSFLIRDGLLGAPIPLAATIFTPENLVFMAMVTLGLSLLARLPAPSRRGRRPGGGEGPRPHRVVRGPGAPGRAHPRRMADARALAQPGHRRARPRLRRPPGARRRP